MECSSISLQDKTFGNKNSIGLVIPPKGEELSSVLAVGAAAQTLQINNSGDGGTVHPQFTYPYICAKGHTLGDIFPSMPNVCNSEHDKFHRSIIKSGMDNNESSIVVVLVLVLVNADADSGGGGGGGGGGDGVVVMLLFAVVTLPQMGQGSYNKQSYVPGIVSNSGNITRSP